MESFVAWIRKTLADDEIQVKYLHTSRANESPFDTEEYRIITEVMEHHCPGSVVTPSLLTGGSDSRFYRDKGVPTYGIFPAVVPMADVTGMIHGVDEKVSVDNMITGTRDSHGYGQETLHVTAEEREDAMKIREVDKVEITTLQDNYIDLLMRDNSDVVSGRCRSRTWRSRTRFWPSTGFRRSLA